MALKFQKKYLFLLLLFLIIVGLVFVLGKTNNHPVEEVSAQAQNTDWPQFQHDPQHTGRTTASVTPNYKVTWAWADKNHIVRNFVSAAGKNITDGFEPDYKFSVMFSGQMQPIIAAGKAYFGALNGVMYAVDALTGDNRWDFTTGGPVLGSAAYDNNTIIVGSMDGKIYGLDANNGSLKWSYQTGGGINVPPVVSQGVAFVGSRDGNMYAFNVSTGSLLWSYSTFNSAPIIAPPAISEDGQTLLFGAENMFFYSLNTSSGQEKWNPKKLIGQSFLYGWPVVAGDKVIVRTMSSLPGTEWLMEDVLNALPADPTWSQEKTAIVNWLTQNPHQKTMYVFDIATGNEPYQVAMGRVSGNNYTPFPPVTDNQNRVLTYWRSKRATFFEDGGTFGTNYDPDMSAMDMSTGDRVKINNPSNIKIAPELDNGYQFTVGGNYLYMANHFRGTSSINLTNGTLTRITAQNAKWDCGGFRAWGYQIIYFGNDTEPDCTYTNAKPPSLYNNTIGYVGTPIATTNGRSLLYVNEGDVGMIVAIEKQ